MKEWKVTDIEHAKYLGIIEFQDDNKEWHNFHILETDTRLVFGGVCSVGFTESGYIEKDDMSIDETLQELSTDLETFYNYNYNDGKSYTSHIVHNERM